MTENTPIWQLSVGQFTDIIRSAISNQQAIPSALLEQPKEDKRYVYGMAGLARLLGCSIVTANRIKKSGVINKAISQVGRKIIVDADLALELLNNSRKQNPRKH